MVALPHLADAVDIDGSVNDPAWKSATELTNFLLAESGALAQEQTFIRMGHDDQKLYILIRASAFALDPVSNMRDSFKADIRQRDGNVWSDDSVELRFVVQSQDNLTATYVAVNALGTLLDMRQTDSGWDKAWTGDIAVTARQANGYWVAELAIPWQELGVAGPTAITSFRFNAVRFEQRLGERSSWANLADGNHMNHANLAQLQIGKNRLAVKQKTMDALPRAGGKIGVVLVWDRSQNVTCRTQLLQGDTVVAEAAEHVKMTHGMQDIQMAFPQFDGKVVATSLRYVVEAGGQVVCQSPRYAFASSDAQLSIAAKSDVPLSVYVNGKMVVSDVAEVTDVVAPLKPGANVIAIRMAVGHALVGQVTGPNGLVIPIDATWRMAAASDAAVKTQADDTSWLTASDDIQAGGVRGEVAGADQVVLRKTILHQVTQFYPKLPDGIWQLTEGGTYMLHWDGSGLSQWEIDRQLEAYTLTVDVPKRLTLVGAATRPIANTAAVDAGIAPSEPNTQYTCEDQGLVFHDGKQYQRYVITRASPVSLTAEKESWLQRRHRRFQGLWLAIRAEKGTSAQALPPLVYWAQAHDGSYIEVPGQLQVAVQPALAGRQPEQIRVMLYGHSGLLTNPQMLEGYFDTIASTGVNEYFGESESSYPKKISLSQTDFFNFGTSSRVGFGLAHVMIDELLAKYPEAQAVAFSGRRMPTPCLSYLARHDEPWSLIETQIASMAKRNPSMTQIFWDYEFPPFPEGLHAYPMFSEHGIRTFRQQYNIQSELTPEVIREKYAAQWVDFTTGEIASVLSKLQKIAHSHGLQLTMYSGYESEYTHRRYNVDWTKYGPFIDRAYAGYTHDRNLIDVTRKAIGDKPLVGGLLLMGKTAQSHSAAQILRKIVDHRGGVLCWYESRFDARTLIPIAQASRLVAEYEQMILYGKRIESQVIHRPHLVGDVAAFEYEGNVLVVMLNDRSTTTRIFDFGLPGGAALSPEFYTGKQYQAGSKAIVPVPGGEARAVLMRRK